MSSLITRETLVVSSLIFFVLSLVLSSLLSVTVFAQTFERSDVGTTYSPSLSDFFGFYVSLLTFQVIGVHPLVQVLMWLPWSAMVVAVISLIRG